MTLQGETGLSSHHLAPPLSRPSALQPQVCFLSLSTPNPPCNMLFSPSLLRPSAHAISLALPPSLLSSASISFDNLFFDTAIAVLQLADEKLSPAAIRQITLPLR